MTPEQEARRQETERLLRQALHQRAQRVEPSPDAFFTINQRIARKEERLKLPAMLRVRLQPSMVASIVLLIALSVVTTLLLTRDDSNAQPVDIAETPSSTVPEPPEETPPVSQPQPPVSAPEPTEKQEAPGQQGRQDGQSRQGGQDPQIITGTTPDTTTTSPPPVSESPPASATSAPPTTEQVPTTTAPAPPPEPAYAIRPLQVASKGRVIVYEYHDTSSEQLGVIPVSLDEGAYLSTGIRATDYDGNHWSEVHLPSGETGWVELETVAIMPSPFSETQKSDLVAAGYQLLGMVAANEVSDSDGDSAAPVLLLDSSLNVSSRGIYLASVAGPGTVYNRYSPSQFLDAFGAEDTEERSSAVTALYSQLACLVGNSNVTFGEDSDIAAPVAMQVLPYVAITGINNTCKVLVYFDYLRGQAEIIGFSTHD